jgi:hypothetical protein
MSFLRLTPGHVIAAAAALVLMLVTAADWYTTAEGEESRRIESIQGEPEPGSAGQISREVRESASITAESEERNAWDPDGPFDVIVLVAVLTAVVLALLAAVLRAAGRSYEPPLTPSVLAGGVATIAAVLVLARMIQKPLAEAGAEIEPGAPAALVALGALALGAALAARVERDEGAHGVERDDDTARAPAAR